MEEFTRTMAIAALQPSSAEREELAQKIERSYGHWFSWTDESGKREAFDMTNHPTLMRVCEVLRAPVAVDDATRKGLTEFANELAECAKDGHRYQMTAKDCTEIAGWIEAVLQAGRK